MSADNGIYIAQFDDGFRVIHAQAIENIDYPFETEREAKLEVWDYFKDSPLFLTEREAVTYAWGLSKNYDILEYGISSVGNRGEWVDFEHGD